MLHLGIYIPSLYLAQQLRKRNRMKINCFMTAVGVTTVATSAKVVKDNIVISRKYTEYTKKVIALNLEVMK